MNKKLALLIIVLLSLPATMFAQGKLIAEAEKEMQAGQYETAVKKINQVLGSDGVIKPKQHISALECRMRSYLELPAYYQKLVDSGQTLTKQQQRWMVDGPLLAYFDHEELTTELEVDMNNYTKERQELEGKSLQFAATLLTTMYRVNSAQQKDIDRMLAYGEMAARLNPRNYTASDLYAQGLLYAADTASARTQFANAIAIHKKNPPLNSDPLVGYCYYRLSVIHRYYDRDVKKALAVTKDGIATLEAEKADLTEDSPPSAVKGYKQAIEDLRNWQLDLYLNAPGLRKEALAEFEAAVNGPKAESATVHLAYGSLLESAGEKEKAIKMYKRATELEPKNAHAWFNLGSLHFSQGGASAGKLLDPDLSDAEFTKYDTEMREHYRASKVAFEKANLIEPCDATTLKALKTIYMTLGDDESIQKFREIKKAQADCGL